MLTANGFVTIGAMPYLFTCPHCQTKTQVEDRFSGKSGTCVSCGEPIQLPAFNTTTTQQNSSKQNRSIGAIVAATVVLVLLAAVLIAAIRFGSRTVTTLQSSRERTKSIRNIEKIAAALNAYAADHGTYPPPYTKDASGMPLHSWRVLILPYLGKDDIYNNFDLSVAWNMGNNLNVAYQNVPVVFQHPNRNSAGLYNESAYYLITGTGTLFPPTGPLGPDSFADDPSQTILVTEAMPLTTSGVWTEPVDLDNSLLQGTIGVTRSELGGVLDDGVIIVTVDERAHYLDTSTPPATVKALITPRGGEPLADDTLDM